MEGISEEGVCLSNYLHKIINMRKNVNLSLEVKVYQEAKRMVPTGQVSSLINNLLKEHLEKQKKERLIASYKKTASSKAIKTEDKIWEDAIADGIDKQ